MNRARQVNLAVLSLAVMVVGAALGGGSPVIAAVANGPSETTTIPYSGTVHGAPENVFLSGLVEVTTTVVRDPDFGAPPKVLVTIDFTNVTGRGHKTGQLYVTGGNQVLIRPLVAADVVDVVFPFYPSGAGGALQARSALASFTLRYNTTTGRAAGASASTSVDAAPDANAAPVTE